MTFLEGLGRDVRAKDTVPSIDRRSVGDLVPGLFELSPAAVLACAQIAGESTDLANVCLDDLTASRRAGLVRAIADCWIELAFDRPISELAPSLSLVDLGIETARMPTRAYNSLVRRGLATWRDVASLSPAQLLKTRNMGRLSIREILAFAVEVAYANTSSNVAPARTEQAPTDELGGDAGHSDAVDDYAVRELVTAIGVSLAWAEMEFGVDDVVEAIAMSTGPHAPSEVRNAFSNLSKVDLGFASRPYAATFDVDRATAEVLSELDARELNILRDRVTALSRPPTLEDLGKRYEVTRERIRQIEAKALRKLRTTLMRSNAAVIKRSAERLRAAIGVAFPIEMLASNPTAIQILGGENLESDRSRLLLWLAGPYQLGDEWLALARERDAAAEALLVALEIEAMDEAGASELLVANGFVPAAAAAWIPNIPHVRIRGDKVMLWGSKAGDRAVALLTDYGTPMTLNEIAREMEHRYPRSLANSLLADPRIMRTGIKHFGLRTWDFNEYTNITEEIEEEILRRGGEAPLDELVETLVSQFGVAAASVRSYASSRRFERSAGVLRLKEDSPFDPDAFARAVSYTPSCFRLDGGWAWRLPVGEDLLRGSGRLMPSGFAIDVGLVPGAAMAIPWPYGELRLSWIGNQPQCGSVRVALEANAMVAGDFGFLCFQEESGMLDFLHQAAAPLASVSPAERIHLETGGAWRKRKSDLFADLGQALGFSDVPVASARAIVRRLHARREVGLIQLFDQAVESAT